MLKEKRGITLIKLLIKLLVVIAILALLASILLVGLRGARERAQLVRLFHWTESIHHYLRDDLVAGWDFNEPEGHIVSDLTGLHRGTIHGGVTRVEGVNGLTGRALRFVGPPDRVVIPHSPHFDITDAITLSVWVKREADWTDFWRCIVGKPVDGVYSLGFDWRAGQPATFNIISRKDWYMLIGGPTPLNEWIHIVGTYDRTKSVMKLYYNGILNRFRHIGDRPIDTNTAPIHIGGLGRYIFPGIIDEVRIYSRALTAVEIQQLFVEGAARKGLSLK